MKLLQPAGALCVRGFGRDVGIIGRSSIRANSPATTVDRVDQWPVGSIYSDPHLACEMNMPRLPPERLEDDDPLPKLSVRLKEVLRSSKTRNGVLWHTAIEQMVLNSVVRYVNIFMHGWHTLTMWYVTEVCSVWHEKRVKCSGIYTLVDLNCSVPAMCLQQPSAAPWNVWTFPQLDNCASHLNHLHRPSHHYAFRHIVLNLDFFTHI